MAVGVWEGDEKARRMKEAGAKLAELLEEAKWDMYAERWELAEKQLSNARAIAVSLRDKTLIDSVLDLLKKCYSKQKAELKE